MPDTLVPEVRVDKNGVPVTRHVRQQSGTTGKLIPQPVVAAVTAPLPYPDRETDIDEISTRCATSLGVENTSKATIVAALSGYSDHTIKVIKQYMGDGDDKTHYSELAYLIGFQYPEPDVREYMMYSYEAADCDDLTETLRYVKGLRHYKPFKDAEDLTLVNKDLEASGRALIRIAFHLHCMQEDDHPAAVYAPDPHDEDEQVPVIKSPSLVALVLNNPDRSSDIAEYIEENNFKSTKTLSQMIEGTHHATQKGFL